MRSMSRWWRTNATASSSSSVGPPLASRAGLPSRAVSRCGSVVFMVAAPSTSQPLPGSASSRPRPAHRGVRPSPRGPTPPDDPPRIRVLRPSPSGAAACYAETPEGWRTAVMSTHWLYTHLGVAADPALVAELLASRAAALLRQALDLPAEAREPLVVEVYVDDGGSLRRERVALSLGAVARAGSWVRMALRWQP